MTDTIWNSERIEIRKHNDYRVIRCGKEYTFTTYNDADKFSPSSQYKTDGTIAQNGNVIGRWKK